jgi:quinoprotein glucose dehydrogenase
VGNSPRGASYRRKGLGRIARPADPGLRGAALAACAQTPGAEAPAATRLPATFDYAGWDSYLGGSDSSQFSSLDQINRDNVNQLEVAWTYETGAGQPPLFNPTSPTG